VRGPQHIADQSYLNSDQKLEDKLKRRDQAV
jgi:hypothetical protein